MARRVGVSVHVCPHVHDREDSTMEVTGAQALLRCLELEGVDLVFGLPGGAVLPIYDALVDSPIRHVLARHEQGAGHMAEGYAHVTGRPGVAIVTSGPGVTNVVTPLCDALCDSIPLVVISGQVASTAIGSDAFQECNTMGLTLPVTKWSWMPAGPEEIPATVRRAFHVTTTGRPGPVLIDLPKDVAAARFRWDGARAALDSAPAAIAPEQADVVAAVGLLGRSERPVVYAGGGVLRARAAAELLALVDAAQLPVVTTLMARSAVPDDHPLMLGMPGMHGTYAAVAALQHADLVIAVGARFDDRVTGRVDAFAPRARVIHVDIDPGEHGKVRSADVSLVGDCASVLSALLRELRDAAGSLRGGRDAWHAQLDAWRLRYPLVYRQPSQGHPKPQLVIERLCARSPEDTVVVAGVGQHQMWASQHWRFRRPHTWLTSGGLGTMGFAVPAAIGAKLARPDATVWAIDGDGCFQMTAQELATAARERVAIRVAVLNNGAHGMVRQWQEMVYGGRYSHSALSRELPDVVRWAEAMGCVGLRATTVDEVDGVIDAANGITDRPVVLDMHVDATENVYPMVPAGASNDEIIVDPSLRDGRAAVGSGGRR